MSNANSEWLSEYSSLKQTLLTKRKAGLPISHDEVVYFNSTASSLDSKLKMLSAAQRSNGLVGSEIARRQVLVDNFKKLVTSLKGQSAPAAAVGPGTSSSSGLPVRQVSTDSDVVDDDQQYDGSMSFTGAGGRKSGYSPISTSEQGLSMRLMEMAGLQDDMLNDIGTGVGRLHAQAQDMHSESLMHERLLDNMEGNIDLAVVSLAAEARRAAKVREKVFAFRLYVCLVLEVVILVMLLLIMGNR